MSGGFEWQNDTLAAELARMRKRAADPSGPLEAIGLLMVASTQTTIDVGGRPEKFAPWSTRVPTGWAAQFGSYAERRAGGKILVLSSALLNSITHEVGDWEVSWGSNLVYAARMQFGWPPGSADETPARPYINEPFPEDVADIEDILLQWIMGN